MQQELKTSLKAPAGLFVVKNTANDAVGQVYYRAGQIGHSDSNGSHRCDVFSELCRSGVKLRKRFSEYGEYIENLIWYFKFENVWKLAWINVF